jgi:hypothetical protein
MLNEEMHIYIDIHTWKSRGSYRVSKFRSGFLCYRPFLRLVLRSSMALVPTETNRISVDRNPTLCTSVVDPGGLPRAIPSLRNTKNPYRKKTNRVQYLFITLIRVHLFGSCRIEVHQD